MSVRVRFAPSPTGYLHIGGARTALFNWLFARHHGGRFILRIEDTDAARNSQEAVDVILDGLRWLGLDWDEGPASANADGPSRGDHGPYFQSRRLEHYRRRVESLLSAGHAYEQDGAVKFRMPRETVVIPDLVVGDVERKLTDREELDPDFVIVRSDGQPVFHLVNVVDDLEMGMTHVIRGEDHLSNTSKHIALFRAFGAEPPRYAHIPLILNPDGSKMSKRDRGASLGTYRAEGISPEAVFNFLCLLGWSPKNDREVMSVDEVVGLFDLPGVLRAAARFDWTKLQWMNFEHIKRMTSSRFVELGGEALAVAGCPVAGHSTDYVSRALDTCREKIKQFTDLPGFAAFYFVDEVGYDPALAAKEFVPANAEKLERLRSLFEGMNPLDASGVEKGMKALAVEMGGKVGMLVHPLRLALTGSAVGPSLYHLVEVLGRERVLRRLDRALGTIDHAA